MSEFCNATEDYFYSLGGVTKHLVLSAIMNVVPCPSSLSTLTDPPMSSIKDLQILSPKPVP